MMERKKDWIADALSELDDKYIDEAVEYVKPKKSFKYIKQISVLAACLLLFVGVGVAVRMGVGGNKTASMEASPGVAKPKEETSAAAAAPMETEAAAELEAAPEATEDAGLEEEQGMSQVTTTENSSVILDTMESQLKAYPNELDEEVLYDMYVCAHGSVVSGQKVWDVFYESVNAGENAQVEIMEYTVEGDPIITSIHYENDRFYIVVDSSRDTFGGNEKYTSYVYDYWKVIDEPQEDGFVLRTVHFANAPLDVFDSEEDIVGYVREQSENSGMEIRTILYVFIEN